MGSWWQWNGDPGYLLEQVEAGVACARPSASVYFLVGDHNPLHALAVQLRDHYARCEGDVTWALLPGADHAAEWRALASHEGAILDWLAGKQRG